MPCPPEPWVHHDFDRVMERSRHLHALRRTGPAIGIDGEALYTLCRELYERHCPPPEVPPGSPPRIPRIIHQIWLGGPVPRIFERYLRTWRERHGAAWEVRLWTDAEAARLPLVNRSYLEATPCRGIRSDLLKWEILYRYGGLYVDVDAECLSPFDRLHQATDLHIALQPLQSGFLQLGASVIGAAPGHPVLRHCIETIADDWHHRGAPRRSGPLHLTRSLHAMAGREGRIDVVLPALYYYPLGCWSTRLEYRRWRAAGALAVHHWARSWMPPEHRAARFRGLGNEAATARWNDCGGVTESPSR